MFLSVYLQKASDPARALLLNSHVHVYKLGDVPFFPERILSDASVSKPFCMVSSHPPRPDHKTGNTFSSFVPKILGAVPDGGLFPPCHFDSVLALSHRRPLKKSQIIW